MRLSRKEKRVQGGKRFNSATKNTLGKLSLEDFSICLIRLNLTDAHAHLNESALADRASRESYLENLRVISNSVDLESSLRNIKISNNCNSIIPFVGIHPEVFARTENLSSSQLDEMIDSISLLIKNAKGIGEIGLDPKYGNMNDQSYLLDRMLSIAERTNLPVTFHCRETSSKILDKLGSYKLRGNKLFHWFAGSPSELSLLHERGFYTSFGPSILFSRRIADLVKLSDRNMILVETDSPTTFRSLVDGPSLPSFAWSVAFQIGLLLDASFSEVCELVNRNANEYLLSQD